MSVSSVFFSAAGSFSSASGVANKNEPILLILLSTRSLINERTFSWIVFCLTASSACFATLSLTFSVDAEMCVFFDSPSFSYSSSSTSRSTFSITTWGPKLATSATIEFCSILTVFLSKGVLLFILFSYTNSFLL